MNKAELLALAADPTTAMTGRYESWLRDPESRLPVSCTVKVVEDLPDSWHFTSKALRFAAGVALHLSDVVHPQALAVNYEITWTPAVEHECELHIQVNDTMEGETTCTGNYVQTSIEGSWGEFYWALRAGINVHVDLSALRPEGTANGRGLVASGPESFAKIYKAIAAYVADPHIGTLAGTYSAINEVLRRGGHFKNGAITLHLDSTHPEVEAFIRLQPGDIPWAKRAVCLLEFPDLPLLLILCQQVAAGLVWLTKPKYDKQDRRLRSNVCLEILIRSMATCLLQHVNLAKCKISDIPAAFVHGMNMLCNTHPITGVGESGIYLSPEEDKQVGLGVIGLASLLAIEGISYRQLVEAWEALLEDFLVLDTKASRLAAAIMEGMQAGAEVAKSYGMERSLTVAPTASCAYRYEDLDGYTTTPEISPPITKSIDRLSGTFGVQTYDHHPRVETALEVGYDIYFRLADCWQQSMERTGQAHSISLNIWDTQPVTPEFIQRWWDSSLVTTYYRLPVQQQASLDKTTIQTAASCGLKPSECSSCAE